jgi:hypothetical protein
MPDVQVALRYCCDPSTHLLTVLGLPERLDYRPANLSRRLAVAHALVEDRAGVGAWSRVAAVRS